MSNTAESVPVRGDQQNRADSPDALQHRALAHLGFIRDTMAASGTFTAVSGTGTMLAGATGIAAAIASSLPSLQEAWLAIWLLACAVAVATGAIATWRKARRLGAALHHGVGLRFVLSLFPAIVAAAVLTPVLYAAGQQHLLPGVWLMMYGVGVIAGGAFSVRIVPLMGALFVLLGITTFVLPQNWAVAMLGVGFGGLHLIFGLIIARHHGG